MDQGINPAQIPWEWPTGFLVGGLDAFPQRAEIGVGESHCVTPSSRTG